jgi:hypothetical protein
LCSSKVELFKQCIIMSISIPTYILFFLYGGPKYVRS